MGLKLICGMSGTGKSEYIYNKIKQNPSKKTYIITPEQFSFSAEKRLVNNIENGAVLNSEVITFNRMAHRIFLEVSGAADVMLDISGRAMLIYSLLLDKKKELKFLSNSNENTELVCNTFTEFKKHNINTEKLENIIEKTDNTYLKYKLQDMYLLYKSFENQIKEKFIDSEDCLTLVAEKIEKSEMFENSDIYIDEFAGFTKQEYKIIEKLLKKAENVYITICTDENIRTSNKETDIFYQNKQTINKLIEISGEPEEIIYLDKYYKFKTDELKYLSENFTNVSSIKYKEKVENIQIFLEINPYSEIEKIAKEIVSLVRDKNYRYNEISIITKNIDNYSSIIKAVFNKYEIPVFIDEKKDMSQNIVIKYILALLDIYSRNWSYESMFNYIKSDFLDIDKNDIFKLENYCLKYGIKGKKWYLNDWNFKDEQDEKLNELRRKIVNPLLEFKESVDNSKNYEEITKKLYEFLLTNNINEKIETKVKKLESNGNIDLANELMQTFNIIVSVLDEIVLVLGKENTNFEKYRDIFKIGLQNKSLGAIPATIDEVVVGDIDRSRSSKVKVTFIIGLNDGIFGSNIKQEGFFNDKDRENLKTMGMEIAKTTLERLYEEQFNMYKAFTTPEEKLILTYCQSDKAGGALRPSIYITRFKNIFLQINEKSDIINTSQDITNANATFDELLLKIQSKQIDKTWEEVYNWYNQNNLWKEKLQKAIQGLDYTNMPQNLNGKSIKKLYGNVLKTSVSKLEQYRKCPFSFHLKYGLKLKEESNFKIQAIDTGSFMHEIIDEFFKRITKNDISVNNLKENELKEIVNEIIEEKLELNKNYIFTSTSKFISLTNKLKKVIQESIKYIVYQLQKSEFKIKRTEAEFKENKEYPPIKFSLENGQEVEITGKIDRIDLGINEGKKYLKIIDYKSSIRNIDLNEVKARFTIGINNIFRWNNKRRRCKTSRSLLF